MKTQDIASTKISDTRDQAHANGFATFNNYRHVCLDYSKQVDNPEALGLTISVKLPDGKHVTFSIISTNQGKTIECVDIQLSESPEFYKPSAAARKMDDKRPRHAQRGIMFGPGYGDNRLVKTSKYGTQLYGTLLTLLVNPNHYNKPEYADPV